MKKDREILRELAGRCAELAGLPVMAERKARWYDHNALRPGKPMIVVEMDTFEAETLPVPRCEDPLAREIEVNLSRSIVHQTLIDDDVVVPDFYGVDMDIEIREFDLDIKRIHARDEEGRDIGFTWEHPIKDIEREIGSLRHSTFAYEAGKTETRRAFADSMIGDILPVRLKNESLRWFGMPSAKIVDLMGLEAMMYAFADYPDTMKALYRFIVGDLISCLEWQEREGLLTPNNGNQYAGAGSYGFTDELPRTGGPGRIRSTGDLWGNLNSQETVSVSPEMYREIVYPAYAELASRFGLVYYGCCEPVHAIWEGCLAGLPNLRKVSISPWCDEAIMGEALRGGRVIYSRKPSPNFLGVGRDLDEEGFSRHIAKTLESARGCGLEFIFRDVYTLSGDTGNPGGAVRIVRDLVDRMWK
jgi:hypothetical protein